MKKLVITGLTAAALLLGMSVGYAKELKIGVMNVHEVIEHSKEVQGIRSRLQEQFKPRQEKLVKEGTSLKSEMDKYNRDAAVMSQAQKQKAQEAIMKRQQEVQIAEQKFQQEVTTAQNQEMTKYFTKLKQVVDNYAEKNQYDLILQKDAAPYSSAQVDVTKQIEQLIG